MQLYKCVGSVYGICAHRNMLLCKNGFYLKKKTRLSFPENDALVCMSNTQIKE